MKTTEQVTTPPNPTGKGGFGDNPQNRNPGGWKKEESIPYLYNKFGRLSPEERNSIEPKTTFEKIALARLKAAEDTKSGLPDTKEITDRTEGKSPQSIDLTTQGDSIKQDVPEEIVRDFTQFLKERTKK